LDINTLNSCRHFVETFKNISGDRNTYLVPPDGYTIREPLSVGFRGEVKPDKNFKTAQIVAVARQCITLLEASSSDFLTDRRELLSSLESELRQYSFRVEQSITRRWWYQILHFFGYQAKKPQAVENLFEEIKTAQTTVQHSIEKQVEEDRKREEEIRKNNEKLKKKPKIIQPEKVASPSAESQKNHDIFAQKIESLERMCKEKEAVLLKIYQCEDRKELERLKHDEKATAECFRLPNIKIPGDILLKISKLSRRFAELERSVWNAVEERHAFLDAYGSTEQQQAIKNEMEKIEESRRKLDSIRNEYPQKFEEAVRKQRQESFLSSFPLEEEGRKLAHDIYVIMVDDLMHSRFWLPVGDDSKLLLARTVSACIREVFNIAQELVDEIESKAGIRRNDSSRVGKGKKGFVAAVEQLHYDFADILKKSGENTLFMKCLQNIEESLERKDPAILFGIQSLPSTVQEFRKIVRQLLVKIHPDKHPEHQYASSSLFIVIDTVKAFVLKQHYGEDLPG
jgi:hypothetical protein